MKTISEFMQALDEYFDGLKNKTVAQLVVDELRYIKPTDLDALFRQLVISQPASWKPDLKAVVDAIKALKLDTLADPQSEKTCPVCGVINTSSGICPSCKYDGGIRDGTPDEYRAWWNDWKAGKVARFDWSSINIKTVDRQPCKTLPNEREGT